VNDIQHGRGLSASREIRNSVVAGRGHRPFKVWLTRQRSSIPSVRPGELSTMHKRATPSPPPADIHTLLCPRGTSKLSLKSLVLACIHCRVPWCLLDAYSTAYAGTACHPCRRCYLYCVCVCVCVCIWVVFLSFSSFFSFVAILVPHCAKNGTELIFTQIEYLHRAMYVKKKKIGGRTGLAGPTHWVENAGEKKREEGSPSHPTQPTNQPSQPPPPPLPVVVVVVGLQKYIKQNETEVKQNKIK